VTNDEHNAADGRFSTACYIRGNTRAMPIAVPSQPEHTRFGFGKNWQRYALLVDEERIAEAAQSLKTMLGCESLHGKSFLDIGSGSGLFSLAALRLGARVVSFDYDAHSVECTAALQKKFNPDTHDWAIHQGSVLDTDFATSLGLFDVVYSWGVLHHTGNMWQALDNARLPLKNDGRLFIALYNDQGIRSLIWKAVKRLYCSSAFGRAAVVAACIPALTAAATVLDVCRGTSPLARYREYKRKNRGMSVYYDWIDWLGGYPFEVAKPEQVIAFYKKKGLTLQTLKTTKSWGNNEFVFAMTSPPIQ
jgi:2-polyprenyl-6-hydroxyphenyl methylase/3-demethylubiquinone-9 3-methyltransferase